MTQPPEIESASTDLRLLLPIAALHVLLLSVGFLVLVAVFDFPDVLRLSAAERLERFSANAGAIVPAYYAMALSGLTQVALATVLFLLLGRSGAVATLALVFGVICGVAQFAGFIRWAIVVPWLAELHRLGAVEPALLELLESIVNRYGGMAIGEHLGFLCQGLWLSGLALVVRSSAILSPAYAMPIGVLGALHLLASLEQLGGPFHAVGMLSAPAGGAWLGLLLAVGIALRRGPGTAFDRVAGLVTVSAVGVMAGAAML